MSPSQRSTPAEHLRSMAGGLGGSVKRCTLLFLDFSDPALLETAGARGGRRVRLFASVGRLISELASRSEVVFACGEPTPHLGVDIPVERETVSAPWPLYVGTVCMSSSIDWLRVGRHVELLKAFRLADGESLHVSRNWLTLVRRIIQNAEADLDRMEQLAASLEEKSDAGAAQAPAGLLPRGFEGLEALAEAWGEGDDLLRVERIGELDEPSRMELASAIRPYLARISAVLDAAGDRLTDAEIRLQRLGELGAELLSQESRRKLRQH